MAPDDIPSEQLVDAQRFEFGRNGHRRMSASRAVLDKLYTPPSAYFEDVLFRHGGGTELSYRYETGGETRPARIRFSRVRSFQFRTEAAADLSDPEVDGELVEIFDSPWIMNVRARQASFGDWEWPIRHLLCYFSDAGAYDIAAADYEWIERPV